MATKDNAQDEKPLDRKRLKFIAKFRKVRNIYKAAEAAGSTDAEALITGIPPLGVFPQTRVDGTIRAFWWGFINL